MDEQKPLYQHEDNHQQPWIRLYQQIFHLWLQWTSQTSNLGLNVEV